MKQTTHYCINRIRADTNIILPNTKVKTRKGETQLSQVSVHKPIAIVELTSQFHNPTDVQWKDFVDNIYIDNDPDIIDIEQQQQEKVFDHFAQQNAQGSLNLQVNKVQLNQH